MKVLLNGAGSAQLSVKLPVFLRGFHQLQVGCVGSHASSAFGPARVSLLEEITTHNKVRTLEGTFEA